jgi:hypothetical protein
MVVTRAVEEYLARAPEGHRMALKQLREAVVSVVLTPMTKLVRARAAEIDGVRRQ